MSRRRKLPRKVSRKKFIRGAQTQSVNVQAPPMRGGFRI